MRSAVFDGPGAVRVDDLERPEPGAGEVRVEVRAAGVCGSDLHVYRGEDPWGSGGFWPRRLGHELAGVVDALGPDLEPGEDLYPGQRVVVEPLHLTGCGGCPQCRRGATHLCPTRGVRNGRRRASAGFAQYDLAFPESLVPVPESLSLEEACLADVYACAIHALHRVPVEPTDDVVILGTGPVGLALGQVARLAGARQVVVVGRRGQALERARAAGAADVGVLGGDRDPAPALRTATGGRRARVVFECVGGGGGTLRQAVDLAAPGGTVGILGAVDGDVSVAYAEANRRELTLAFSSSYATHRGVREIEIARDLLARGRVDGAALVTHRFPLEQIDEAFEAARDKARSGAVKVIVEPFADAEATREAA